MRLRPAALFLVGLVFACLAIAGCTSGGGSAGDGDTGDQNGLEVGTTAPDFRMKNQDQETVALSDYKGTKNVVLVFYPADFTPV
jgi:cytochrome oxidase Cu insertion factor (SCO1/SenC/PrrC family)